MKLTPKAKEIALKIARKRYFEKTGFEFLEGHKPDFIIGFVDALIQLQTNPELLAAQRLQPIPTDKYVESSFIDVLLENYEATKIMTEDHPKYQSKFILIETYEDLIAIFENKHWYPVDEKEYGICKCKHSTGTISVDVCNLCGHSVEPIFPIHPIPTDPVKSPRWRKYDLDNFPMEANVVFIRYSGFKDTAYYDSGVWTNANTDEELPKAFVNDLEWLEETTEPIYTQSQVQPLLDALEDHINLMKSYPDGWFDDSEVKLTEKSEKCLSNFNK